MTKKTAFWIFFIGTVSSAVVFLWLTWDTHRQIETLSHVDKLSDKVVEGKRAFEKYNCNDCHTILGFGAYYAPDLTKVVQRIGEDGIRIRIKDPEKALASSWRKMPNLKVSDAEIDNLIAFFTWVGNIDNGDWPPQDSKKRLSRSEERMVAGVGVSPGAAVFQIAGMHELPFLARDRRNLRSGTGYDRTEAEHGADRTLHQEPQGSEPQSPDACANDTL